MLPVPAPTPRLAACCLVLLLAGCATTGEPHPADPFESANRGVYAVNVAVDRATLRPVARGYVKATPKWMQTVVTNFFFNLGMPFTIVNQLLQGKPKEAGQDTLRFALNTTLGLGGLFDPAKDANLPRHDEDLGQTLGVWGVPPGPYLMLPLLGPSHLRDLPSHVVDRFLSPLYWYDSGNARWISLGLSLVDMRARLLPLDATLERVYDPYGFIREAFIQRRLYQVWDGNIPEHLLPRDDFDVEDDAELELPEDEATDESPPDASPEQPPPGQAD